MSQTEQDVLRKAVKHYSRNLRISQTELAKSADVSQPLISAFVSGKTNLSGGSMDRIRKALLELIQDRTMAVGFFPASPVALPSGGKQLTHAEA